MNIIKNNRISLNIINVVCGCAGSAELTFTTFSLHKHFLNYSGKFGPGKPEKHIIKLVGLNVLRLKLLASLKYK